MRSRRGAEAAAAGREAAAVAGAAVAAEAVVMLAAEAAVAAAVQTLNPKTSPLRRLERGTDATRAAVWWRR